MARHAVVDWVRSRKGRRRLFQAIDDTDAPDRVRDPRADPETSLQAAQLNERFEAAVRRLPPEDAAIVRLKYVEGLTNATIERALGITGLGTRRLQEILARLRAA